MKNLKQTRRIKNLELTIFCFAGNSHGTYDPTHSFVKLKSICLDLWSYSMANVLETIHGHTHVITIKNVTYETDLNLAIAFKFQCFRNVTWCFSCAAFIYIKSNKGTLNHNNLMFSL